MDEGTTSARAALYDARGRDVGMESAPIPCHYPQPGWVEQDALEIWQAQLAAARWVLDHHRVGSRHGPAGRPRHRLAQCRRTAGSCAELAGSKQAREITRRTGLVIEA